MQINIVESEGCYLKPKQLLNCGQGPKITPVN